MNDPWVEVQQRYARYEWTNKPSLFAEQAIGYFPPKGMVLDLGCGLGQDSKFFAGRGYHVVGADIELTAFKKELSSLTELAGTVKAQVLDIGQPLPFDDLSFDVVYAHLSLHFFDRDTTTRIFDEIRRILKPSGIFAFLVNSVTDPEYGTGPSLEADFFHVNRKNKRYFTVEAARFFASEFTELLADTQGETYKDSAKGIHNLVRFIGAKPQ